MELVDDIAFMICLDEIRIHTEPLRFIDDDRSYFTKRYGSIHVSFPRAKQIQIGTVYHDYSFLHIDMFPLYHNVIRPAAASRTPGQM
jgi:hypothetical protein